MNVGCERNLHAICRRKQEGMISVKRAVDDETIEYVSVLAQLDLAVEEKEQVREDISKMLDYMDKLKELDDLDAEPLCDAFSACNVLREDVVTNGNGSGELAEKVPEGMNGMFSVPRNA